MIGRIALALAAPFIKYLFDPIGQQFGNLWKYKSNLKKLKIEVEKLEARTDTVKLLIKVGEEPLPHVKHWQERGSQKIVEALEVVEKQTNIQCCKGFSCPNLIKCCQHSKKVAKKLEDVVELNQEAAQFKEISISTTHEEAELWSNEDGYQVFESRTSILKEIIAALCKTDVNMVGIHGMGGIGKTILAKKVAKQAMQDNLFNEIVFVEVSKTPVITNIQQEIGEKLGLCFHEKSDKGRARVLYDHLKKEVAVSKKADNRGEKKILIILDNIWDKISLESIGIPLESDCKRLKLLLTTRNSNVLTNQMDSQCNFPVDALNEAEAWSLFKSIAGTSTVDHALKPIALEVAKECGGMPIAIVTIAKALKNQGENEWKNALRELKTPSSESFGGIAKEVYTSIKLSYDYLGSDELKQIFLLCSRIGCTFDASIRDLFIYGFGLSLFDKFNTMEEALCYIYTSVNKLKAASLLLNTSKGEACIVYSIPPAYERFAIHDVVCDVARLIAYQDQHAITVINGVNPQSWAKYDMLRKCTSITLHDYGELPEDLPFVCPNLKFLYMKPKESFSKIPDNFFEHMPNLQVLHLVDMDLRELPTSLSCLVNLQAFCLDRCELGDTTLIGNLRKLEILSFHGSNIEKLPEEMRQLTRLRLLDLTDCSKLSVIPPNVMSNLIKLEALYMVNTSIQWEKGNVSIDELKHLRYLTLLEIHIPDPKMAKGLLSQKLERYKIFIGNERVGQQWKGASWTYRMLKLSLDTNEDGIISQLKGIEELQLREVPGATNLLDALDRNGFPTLKHLSVWFNPHCSCIVESCDALPSLESLWVMDLQGLEEICNSPIGANAFLQLRSISLFKCPKLKNIFLSSTVIVLQQLENIVVSNCENMEEIFATEVVISDGLSMPREIISEDEIDISTSQDLEKICNSPVGANTFLRLRTIQVSDCPKLKNIFSSSTIMVLLQLEEIMVFNCENMEEIFAIGGHDTEVITFSKLRIVELQNLPRLKNFCCKVKTPNSEDEIDIPTSLFNEKVVFPNLQTLHISGIHVEKIWHNLTPTLSSCVQNLTKLSVSNCVNIKELFSSSTGVMEESREEDRRDTISFPKLNCLLLENLAELTRFWSGYFMEFPSLKVLEMESCPRLKAFIFDNKAIPCLEKLKLAGKGLVMMWQGQLVRESFFHKLKFLRFEDDEATVSPVGIIQRFPNLEMLSLSGGSYEEIFSYGEDQTQAPTTAKMKILYLRNLGDLKYMWKQDSKLDSILYLEDLEVSWCHSLINLMPSSASFQNLTCLQVHHCDSLENIITTSMARSLVNLIRLGIGHCKNVTEVVANQGDVTEDKIIFNNLKILILIDLPSLTSFCSGNFTLELPSLEEVSVAFCRNMEIFSQGDLTTQKLRKVLIDQSFYDEYPDFNLNTSIEKMNAMPNSTKDSGASCSHHPE